MKLSGYFGYSLLLYCVILYLPIESRAEFMPRSYTCEAPKMSPLPERNVMFATSLENDADDTTAKRKPAITNTGPVPVLLPMPLTPEVISRVITLSDKDRAALAAATLTEYDRSKTDLRGGFTWGSALQQTFVFNSFLQAWRMSFEAGTRAELGGAFFKEYFRSVRRLRGWHDGDTFKTNYIAHPMQGAVAGRIQVQNDARGAKQDFALRKEYFKSRLKAMTWAAAFSANFELGPMSEASLGNVGMKPRHKSRNPMAMVDLVVTPTVGTAWLMGEDAIDRYILQPLERKISAKSLRLALRTALNPTRSAANLLRFKTPWYRDNRTW